MQDNISRKNSISSVSLVLMMISCALLLCACGPVECDFCGRTRFCKKFDILGVERNICNDCLNDPAIAISGNMVRKYSEMYENGSLEYPEGSPLRDDYGAPTEEPDETVSRNRLILEMPSDINVILPDTAEIPDITAPTPTQYDPSHMTGLEPNPSVRPTAPVPAAAGGLSGEALISSLNSKLSADNMSLSPVQNKSGEYTLLSGGNDTKIRFKVSAGTSDKDKLVIEQGENASSSDYVKATIRSILAYTGSDDYEGLGHDIYNGTIQRGTFTNSGLTFISTVHNADEIEKGSPVSDFSIVP